MLPLVSSRDPLSVSDAEALLDGVPLISAMGGSLADIKQVRERCLAAGIPVIMGCPGDGRPGG
jgi:hypothetical protein